MQLKLTLEPHCKDRGPSGMIISAETPLGTDT